MICFWVLLFPNISLYCLITVNKGVFSLIDIKEVDTKKEAHHIVQSFIVNFSVHRKDLQDVLQCSMSRRMPKISPMLLLLLKMIKITRIQLNVL